MKVIITHLKAPWPAGAGVNSVVELPGDKIPGCFVGKCIAAADKAEATHAWEPRAPVVQVPEPAGDGDDLAAAKALLTEAEAEADELRGRLEKALSDLQQSQADLAAAQGELAAAVERATKAEEAAAAKAPKGSSK